MFSFEKSLRLHSLDNGQSQRSEQEINNKQKLRKIKHVEHM